MASSNYKSIYKSKKAFDYGLAFLAFLIPLIPKGLPLVIIGVAILGVFYYVVAYRKVGKEEKNYIFIPYKLLRDSFNNLIKSRNTLLAMVCFFLCYLISAFYSDNQEIAWKGVVLKSSFLYFPILFSLTKWDLKKTKMIFDFFILGCFCNLILSYGFVILDSEGGLKLNEFISSNLSFSFHRSYIAMYINIAIILNTILLFSKRINETIGVIVFRWTSQFLFSLFVIMLSSRSGLLTWFISIILIILFQIFTQKKIVKSLFFAFGMIFIFFFSINNLSFLGGRMEETVQTITNSNYEKDVNGKYTSTGIRVGIWKASLSVLKSSPLFGIGVGDAKDELIKMYQEKRMKLCYESKFNSHNQYLDTGLAIGVVGMLLLCLIVFFSFINFGKLTILTVAMMAVIGGSLFVESMLERQAGVIFISWITALIVSARPVFKSLK